MVTVDAKLKSFPSASDNSFNVSKAVDAEPTIPARLETTFWTNLVDAALSSSVLVSVIVGTVTEPVNTRLFDGALELSIGSITVYQFLVYDVFLIPLFVKYLMDLL